MMSPSLFHVPDVSSFVILWDASASVLMKSKSSKYQIICMCKPLGITTYTWNLFWTEISFIINFCSF